MDPLHLNVKEKCHLNTKNYCITISIQKISSIHIFTFKVQQLLGSHELKSHGHFSIHQPKNNWIDFWLSWIRTSIEKMTLFHLFIFLFLWLATPIFHHAKPKNFQSPFNLCETVKACKKSVSSISSSRKRLATLFLTMPHQKLFNQILIFVNLYQHTKNEVVSLIYSGEMFDLKSHNLNSWKHSSLYLRTKKTYFWPISPILRCKKIFPKNLPLTSW